MRIVALEEDGALMALDEHEALLVFGAVFSSFDVLRDISIYLEEVGMADEAWFQSGYFYVHLAKRMQAAAGRVSRHYSKWRTYDLKQVDQDDAPLAGEVVRLDALGATLRFSRWQIEFFSRVACIAAAGIVDQDFETIMSCKKSHVVALALEFQRAADLLRKPC